MLKILKGQEAAIKGIIVCEESGNASSLPFVLHFLSAAEANQKVTIISSKFSEMNYKLICSKAGVRWNPSQVSFFDALPLPETLEVSAKTSMDEISKKVLECDASVVLFDDISIFQQFGAQPLDFALFIHNLYTELKKKSSQNVVIFAPFSNPSDSLLFLRNRCHVLMQLTPVSHGFGKDASSKAIMTIRTTEGQISKAILLSGERTVTGTWTSTEN